MIIDLRYHVVSLVAVFLALGLGIILGVNMGKTVNLEFEKQLEQLENTYQKLREDQRILQASLQTKESQLEIADQFQKAIVPNFTANRLVGKRIAIIRTNDSVDFKYAKQLVNSLRQAGAEVTSVTTFSKIINLSEPALKTEVMEAFNIPATMASDDKILLTTVYDKIADLIVQGQQSSQLAFLQNKELIQLWGDYNRGYIDTVVFLGGGITPQSNHQKEIDLNLLDSFRKTSTKTVGVETSFATESYMRLYQSKCQGTVDNIDSPAGQATLVYLLASGRRGYYGVKDTARALIPDFKMNY